MHVQQNTEVEISLVDGNIVVEPVEPPAWSLEDLIEGITEENLHLEAEFGPSVGKEVW